MNIKRDAFSIRSFLEELRKSRPEEIFEVDTKVRVDFEPTAYYLNLSKSNPVILFNKVDGFHNFSLVTNIFGSEERLATVAGLNSISEVVERWSSIANSEPNEALLVSEETTPFISKITGEDLNLSDLPVPSHYELDGSKKGFSRYITSGLTTTIDPENQSTINLSFSRIQPFERDKFAFDAGSRGHLWKHLSVSREAGERLKMTILIGPNPIFYLLAASFIDNEYVKANKFFNVKFSKGYLNKIPIPSDTEIAIEAEFLPNETFDEGPFAEYVGYMGYDSTRFVAKVRSILMKRNPIYYDIQPSNSSEHVNLFSVPRSSLVMKSVREALPKDPVYEVKWPHYGGRFMSFGYVDHAESGLAKQLGITILGLDPLWNKIVFINEGKTELTLENALTNLAQLTEFSENHIAKISNTFIISSDPTRNELGNSGKIVFVTEGKSTRVEREVKRDIVKLKTKRGNVLISHDYTDDQKVNVIVSQDIDLKDLDQIGWAISTRLNPDTDINIEKNKITFLATRKVPPVARVPKSVKEKVDRKMALLRDRIH